MAVTPKNPSSWQNDFTIYWSQLYTLYAREIFWHDQLCDNGYTGFPDPQYGIDELAREPDLTAFHEEGDTQHIGIRCFEQLKTTEGDFKGDSLDYVREAIEQVSKFNSIPKSEVSDWLDVRGIDFEPTNQESVALIPKELYELYEEDIEEISSSENVLIWTIEPNGSSTIKKRRGSHSNRRLESAISSGMETYPNADDLLRFSRRTNTDYLKFAFVHKLVNHCARENKLEFSFEDIDEIMTESQPPILGHLPRETRENDFWRDFLYSMLTRFDLIDQSDQENMYVWNKRKFLTEPRYQSRILEKVRNQLDIGEKA